jgi:lysophospholipase L1-like esterase
MTVEMRWVGTWTTSPVVTEGLSFENQTIRMIARSSLGGQTVRVRLSNACGSRKLTVGQARIALRGRASATVPGSDRALTFGGSPATTIAVGALALSDPVALEVPPVADLAVSVYLPGAWLERDGITGHGNAHQTNYVSPPGDFAAAVEMPVARTTESWYLVSAVEVLAPAETGGIVAFGDSLTDANLSSLDANHRWPDQLARRLVARGDRGRRFGVMNQGIGGNRILNDQRGDCGLRRLDRDILAQTGVTHAIVLLGINDIRNRNGRAEEVVSAAEMIAGLDQIAKRAQARGIKIFGGTLLTFEEETFMPGCYTKEGEAKRQAVNRWMRTAGVFDGVIDFEAALRDPAHPTRMLPAYDCGDHLHPSDAGYDRMGDIIDLALFD